MALGARVVWETALADAGEVVRLEAERDREEGDVVWFRGRALVGEENVGRLRFAVRPHAAAGFDEAPARA